VRCSALQCVAVRCSALQCVAMRCSALQCIAVRCSALQCIAVHCSALQCVAVCRSVSQVCYSVLQRVEVGGIILCGDLIEFVTDASCYIAMTPATLWPQPLRKGVAMCCSVLQCVAVCCNVLQCVAIGGEIVRIASMSGCLLLHINCLLYSSLSGSLSPQGSQGNISVNACVYISDQTNLALHMSTHTQSRGAMLYICVYSHICTHVHIYPHIYVCMYPL